MQPPDGDRFHLSGEYLEIERSIRFTYAFAGNNLCPTIARH
jgi:uncharacterized protein YndB with AHSA1/START domain